MSVERIVGRYGVSREPASDSSRVETEEWTWRLLDRGFSAEETAAIRGIELLAVLKHARLILKKGKAVPLDRFLSDSQISSWDAWRTAKGDASPPDESPNGVELWKLFVGSRP